MVPFVVEQQQKFVELIHRLTERDEEGQDMIEYALLAALISIVAIVMILLVGPTIKTIFQDVVNALNSA